MSREIMIIAKNKDGVVSNNIVKIGENGEHIVIKGTKDTFYEIKDMATNRAPDQIYTKRFKNDLKLKINPKGGALDGVGEADVTIENYCANGNCEIVGVHETGEYYQYVPQSGDKGLMTTKMADGEFAYQSLGTVEAGGFRPLSALPLAGLAGLGGGGGGKKPDTTAPDAPNLTMVTDDHDSVAAATGVYWGADTDTGSWNIDSTTGSISISGNVNVTSDGKIITNDNTPTLTGTGEAGTIVRVYDGNIDPNNPTTNLIGETTVANDGTWSITTKELQPYSTVDETSNASPLQNSEHTLNITLTDTAGNVSTPTPIDMIVDTFMTYSMSHLTFTNLDDGNERNDQNVEVGDNHYFTGAFTISDDFVAEGGTGELENVPYQEGDEVYVKLTNQETGEEYLVGGPNNPTTIVDSNGKWSIIIDPTQLYYNKTTNTMEKLLDGHYTNQVIVLEASGDICVSASGTFTSQNGISFGSFGIDTTAPDASQITSITSPDHTLKINVVDSTPLYLFKGDETDGLQRDSDYLTGLGVNEVIIYKDGNLSTPVADIYIGSNSVTDSVFWNDTSIVADGVYEYQLETIDVAGNSSGISETFYAVVDADRNGSYSGATIDVAGTAEDEVFQTDVLNLGFKLDGGGGVDTLVLNPTSTTSTTLTLDSNDTVNFEIYNLGTAATLKIDDLASVQNAGSSYTDHALTIQGKTGGKVDLDTATWADTGVDQVIDGVTYNVYHNSTIDPANINYDLWIQSSVNVI